MTGSNYPDYTVCPDSLHSKLFIEDCVPRKETSVGTWKRYGNNGAGCSSAARKLKPTIALCQRDCVIHSNSAVSKCKAARINPTETLFSTTVSIRLGSHNPYKNPTTATEPASTSNSLHNAQPAHTISTCQFLRCLKKQTAET